MNKKQLVVAWVILMCIFLNGCAILQLPGKVVSGTFNILGTIVGGVFNLIKNVPKPPAGVF